MSEGEAAEIVEEVLSDLLTRICYPPQPPSLETQLTKISYPPHPPPLETEHPLLDLCTLSRELCELLKSYSLRTSTRTRVEVCQIKTLQQKASGKR